MPHVCIRVENTLIVRPQTTASGVTHARDDYRMNLSGLAGVMYAEMPLHNNDADLIRRIARHDGCALADLMGRFERALQRRINDIVRDAAAADDLTQETFLRVWTRAEQFHGGDNAAGWLARIATNLALNHLRGNRRRPIEPLPLMSEKDGGGVPDWIVDPTADDPLEWAGAAEFEQHLRAVLAKLPAEKRAVHQMVEDGVELRAVAEELGIPIGTAKSRLHYTRKHLAEAWQKLAQQREDI
ncbi:MAG: sigma-70 family RNA polymerase sigma factor [Pseudomonadales bacterium]|nr:sigma-70 family RNA polymerase sigma factor [Pseudomonadales bacterium]HJN51869.1 sigma-70 family RNA polymerase sigma factor [Pseudomonadales bacterium]